MFQADDVAKLRARSKKFKLPLPVGVIDEELEVQVLSRIILCSICLCIFLHSTFFVSAYVLLELPGLQPLQLQSRHQVTPQVIITLQRIQYF